MNGSQYEDTQEREIILNNLQNLYNSISQKKSLYDHGMSQVSNQSQDQQSMLFIGLDINQALIEFSQEINNQNIYADQVIIQQKFLKLPGEREMLSLLNLVRIAPIFCVNNIFEIVRNRFLDYDLSKEKQPQFMSNIEGCLFYQDLINTTKSNIPQITKTLEGIEAVDQLILKLNGLQIKYKSKAKNQQKPYVVSPLEWENSLNFLSETPNLFEMIDKGSKELQVFLYSKNIQFQKFEIIKTDLQDTQRAYSFETMIKLLIDDGGSQDSQQIKSFGHSTLQKLIKNNQGQTPRFVRDCLLDEDMHSIFILKNEKTNQLYIIMMGQKIQ